MMIVRALFVLQVFYENRTALKELSVYVPADVASSLAWAACVLGALDCTQLICNRRLVLSAVIIIAIKQAVYMENNLDRFRVKLYVEISLARQQFVGPSRAAKQTCEIAPCLVHVQTELTRPPF